jgi:uncharacterized protein YjiS (DUF1127 family)
VIYLPPLPTSPADLRATIERLELRRQARRDLGRITPVEERQIAAELRELRAALAVAQHTKETCR